MEKLVIFAHHRDVIMGLATSLSRFRPVTLTGETSSTVRQKAIDAFQTDPGVRLFIGNIVAAGTGITLTAASHCVFAELSWVPAELSQCEDRLHRIGTQDSVSVQHLVLEGSLDAMMVKALLRKQRILFRMDMPEAAGVSPFSLARQLIGVPRKPCCLPSASI